MPFVAGLELEATDGMVAISFSMPVRTVEGGIRHVKQSEMECLWGN